MRDLLQFALVLCLAVSIFGVAAFVNGLNKRLFAKGPILGGRIYPRGSKRGFPLIPTKDSDLERKNPVVWLWVMIDLLVVVLVAIWLLVRRG